MARTGQGILWFLAGLMPGMAFAQDTPPTPAPDPVDPPAVVHTGVDSTDRVTIPIHIGGNGPYPFIIDTGSQRTVISRELADRLALIPAEPVRVISMTGVSDVQTVTVPHLSFGTSQMASVQAPVFASDHLGADGLLGLDGLQSKRVVLNFQTGRMDISPSHYRHEKSDSDTIVVTARSKLGQLILLDSRAEGQKVNVILDTGAEYSVGNAALLKKLARRGAGRFSGTVSTMGVTGAVMTGQWGIIEKVTMGSLTLNRLPVMFVEAAPFAELGLTEKPALLLGINALRVFARVAIDFGEKRVDFLMPDQGALAGEKLAALQP